jgi:hypothetical protein
MRKEPSKLGLETIHGIIANENMRYFTPAPTGAMACSDHMVRGGLLKNELEGRLLRQCPQPSRRLIRVPAQRSDPQT